jgi:hypothetical protein
MEDLIQHFNENMEGYVFNFFKLTHHINKMKDHVDMMQKQMRRSACYNNKARFNNKNAHRDISKTLNGPGASPMTCLKRAEDRGEGKPKGSYTTDPQEIDDELHYTWDPITDGFKVINRVANFIKKYSSFIYTQCEYQINDLESDDFIRCCRAKKDSAAGLDGWSASDVALVSDNGLRFISKMLNKIEKGADWPEHMYQTRAVFLSKDHNQTSNPLCYRILKITSIWYRKWGSTRMRDLDVWVNGWNVPELFSGVPEKGAQDAWFQTALFNELGLLKGRDISGASIDVHKCFDQIDRDLAKEILSMSGMPKSP